MMFGAAVAAAVTLLVLPGLAGRVGARLAPREWAWLCSVAVTAGALTLEAALVLRATPGVLDALGVDTIAAACSRVVERLLVGGPAVTWAAAGAAVALVAAAVRGVADSRRVRRHLAADLWLGQTCRRAGHEVVVMPFDRAFAASFDAGRATIVLSRGLLDRLAAEEIDAVVRHEAAHLARRHQRHQTLVAAVAPILGRVPGVGRSLGVLQLALERGADEDAAAITPGGRDVLRRSLLRLLDQPAMPAAVSAFAGARTIAARVDALAAPPPPAGTAVHVALYLPGAVAAAIAAPGLYRSAEHLGSIVAMAGRCMT